MRLRATGDHVSAKHTITISAVSSFTRLTPHGAFRAWNTRIVDAPQWGDLSTATFCFNDADEATATVAVRTMGTIWRSVHSDVRRTRRRHLRRTRLLVSRNPGAVASPVVNETIRNRSGVLTSCSMPGGRPPSLRDRLGGSPFDSLSPA